MSLTLEFMAALFGSIFISSLFAGAFAPASKNAGAFAPASKKIDLNAAQEYKKTMVASAYCNLLYFNYDGLLSVNKAITRPNNTDVSEHCFGNATLNTSNDFAFSHPLKRWFP